MTMRLLTVAAFAFLISCGSSSKIAQYSSLINTVWQLKSLTGVDISDYTNGLPYLNFGSDGTLSGFDGCNNFTGPFSAGTTGELSISNLASQRKMCPGETGQSFLNALGDVSSFTMQGDQLNLLGNAGTLMSLIPKP